MFPTERSTDRQTNELYLCEKWLNKRGSTLREAQDEDIVAYINEVMRAERNSEFNYRYFEDGLKNLFPDAIGDVSNDLFTNGKMENLLSENRMENYIVDNLEELEFTRGYRLFENNTQTGQQFRVASGGKVKIIDILLEKYDKTELLIAEVKKGDGGKDMYIQIRDYITCITDEIARPNNQKVRGLIVLGEDNPLVRSAIKYDPQIEMVVLNNPAPFSGIDAIPY